MVADSGYFSWAATSRYTEPAILERQAVDLCWPFQWTDPAAGGSIPLWTGGAVYQTSPATAYAPLSLAAAEFSGTIKMISEAGSLALERLPHLLASNAARLFFHRPHVDEFLIPSGAKTQWTLSREMPFGWGLSVSTFPPVVKISDPSDLRASADTVLTRSATSPPSAGEYYVDAAANATAIETADISASAGLHLVVLYYPVRQWGGLAAPVSGIPGQDSIGYDSMQLSLVEHVPARVYAGLD